MVVLFVDYSFSIVGVSMFFSSEFPKMIPATTPAIEKRGPTRIKPMIPPAMPQQIFPSKL